MAQHDNRVGRKAGRKKAEPGVRLHRATAEALEARRLLTITVNTLVDQQDGSITDGTISLRDAITASLAGGTINFSVTGTIHLLLGPVEINKNLTIAGPGASQLTIDGGGHSTVINNPVGKTLTLSGLTISGGNDTVDFGGGGVRNLGTLTVSNSVISGNTALLGGGIYSGYQFKYESGGLAFLTVVNSTISGNHAVETAGDPLAGKGGGIYAGDSSANVSNSTLSGNATFGAGGGGSAIYGDPNITDSTISGNSGGGGAIQGYPSVIQSTVCNNFPAGISATGGASIAQSTIVGNEYGIEGIGVTLSNSIIAGNTSADINGTLDPSQCHNNLIGAASGGLTNGVNGNIVNVVDPGIEMNAENQAILANHGGPTQTVLVYDFSLAVNRGNNSLIPNDPSTGQPFTTDQNGAPRVFNTGTVDIGATEIQGLVAASTVVNTTSDEVAANSTTSLREAIGFAEQSTPGTVTFSPTVFSTTQSIQLVLGKLRVFGTSGAITIDGPGASLVEIDGQHLSPDFATTGVATLSGLTIANGSDSQGQGGGIQEYSGTLTISNSVITNNSTDGNGGGINIDDGSLTITDSTISGNQSAGDGGGVANHYGGSVTISDSTISGNTSVFGGGIFSTNGVTITNSTLSGNTASGSGGAGGGIFLTGGGTITDSTISNNTYFGIATNTGLTLTNTIVAGNAPLDFVGDPLTANSTNNLIGTAAPNAGGLVNGVNGNIVGVDPHLGPLANNGGVTQTMALLPNSPAINAGVAVSGVTTDQRGIARPQGSAPDIGAYERVATNSQLIGMSYEYQTREAVTFNFSADASVTFSQSSYVLKNVITNQPVSVGSFSFNTTGTQATLVLTNLLPDASYRVTSGTTTLDFFVLVGDANHDGVINAADYLAIDNGFNHGGALTGFENGDFNYDGLINGDDYTLIDNAFNTQVAMTTAVAVLARAPTEAKLPVSSAIAAIPPIIAVDGYWDARDVSVSRSIWSRYFDGGNGNPILDE